MILPEIKEIKSHRIRLGLSLREFAKKCGLTVSWINQVEVGLEHKDAGIKDPSYLKMKKIFDMLDSEDDVNPITAEELCIPLKKFKKTSKSKSENTMEFSMIGVSIIRLRNTMVRYGISQIPILENGLCLGMITSKTVMDLTIDSNLTKINVDKKILDHNYATVNAKLTLNSLHRIMKYFEYVLVEKEGIIHGILVREDLIK
jgi:predicted transcriptional regulator